MDLGLGISSNTVSPMDEHDVLKIRQCMRNTILIKLQKLNPIPTDEASKPYDLDDAKRLEEGLYKMANTKEEYMNPSNLDSRLASLIKARKLKNHNQLHANSSSLRNVTPTSPGVSAEPTNGKR